ncbi:MAG: aminopeptidase P family N-terminal domain-containing protein, partial [Ilumatobacter sp.]|nr:aminopeptidase P family N-terminal domain-containing protein [Ilumatobacter sp.]
MRNFTPIDHAARVSAIRSLLGADDSGLDALLFTDYNDIRWLTGFTGSNGWVVVRPNQAVLGTDT